MTIELIAVIEDVVWVIPQRLQELDPLLDLWKACSEIPGPGKKIDPGEDSWPKEDLSTKWTDSFRPAEISFFEKSLAWSIVRTWAQNSVDLLWEKKPLRNWYPR